MEFKSTTSEKKRQAQGHDRVATNKRKYDVGDKKRKVTVQACHSLYLLSNIVYTKSGVRANIETKKKVLLLAIVVRQPWCQSSPVNSRINTWSLEHGDIKVEKC